MKHVAHRFSYRAHCWHFSWTASTPRARTSPTTAASRRRTSRTTAGSSATVKKSNSQVWTSAPGRCSGFQQRTRGALSTGPNPSSCVCWRATIPLDTSGWSGLSVICSTLLGISTVPSAARWILVQNATYGSRTTSFLWYSFYL